MSTQSQRVLSLDVFRGLTIVLMILVNSQSTPYPYPLLVHATWNGCTLADLVFPWFLFMVGLSTVISCTKYIKNPEISRRKLYRLIVQRGLILFLIGLYLNAFPAHLYNGGIRVYGVLQRIALCYVIGAVLYLNLSFRALIATFFGLLITYWYVMTSVPVPGIGANQLTPAGSWVAYIDQKIFPAEFLFDAVYDPEGLFNTLPALATTVLGMLTGILLHNKFASKKTSLFLGFSLVGLVLALLGLIWDTYFPINKNLWTSSFVLWTGGLGLLVFAFCYLLVDLWGYTKWALPLKIFGMNALFVFIFHVLLLKILSHYTVTLKNGGTANLKVYLTEYFFSAYSPQNASLLYALSFIFLNFFVVAVLYRKRLFLRL